MDPHNSLKRRTVFKISAGVALAAGVPAAATAQLSDSGVIGLRRIGRYQTGEFDGGAEIVAYHPETQQLFVVNSGIGEVVVLDVSDPTSPQREETLNAAEDVPDGDGVNSVDVGGDLVGVAVEPPNAQANGRLAFYSTETLQLQEDVEVGALPDKVTLSPDGDFAVSANEGEPAYDEEPGSRTDPSGSISVVTLTDGVDDASVETLGFEAYDGDVASLRAEGARIYGASAQVEDPQPSTDFEPEFVSLTDDGQTAFVSLQENNAIATVNVPAAEIVDISGLGFKNFSLPQNIVDTSDVDGVDFDNWPIFGMYQPDSIAAFTAGGQSYVATANEGDSRDYEETSVSELSLDPASFDLSSYPVDTVEELQQPEHLGNLEVTSELGDIDGDDQHEQLYAYGGRSMSIWRLENDGLQLVYDSGSLFEEIQAEQYPDGFQNTTESGPETEAVTIGSIGDRTYAFVGQERGSGVMTFDVTIPSNPTYISTAVNRDYSVSFDDLAADADANAETDSPGRAGDWGPEGVEFVSPSDSPTDTALLMVGFEVSGTVAIFEVLGGTETRQTSAQNSQQPFSSFSLQDIVSWLFS